MTSEVTSGIKVFTRHIRAQKICMGGARPWAAENGIDWALLTGKNAPGVPVESLEATGDTFALEVAAEARAEHGRG